MAFTDTIKAALAKKQAAQHPDARADNSGTKPVGVAKPVVKKPPKKVTGRGRWNFGKLSFENPVRAQKNVVSGSAPTQQKKRAGDCKSYMGPGPCPICLDRSRNK